MVVDGPFGTSVDYVAVLLRMTEHSYPIIMDRPGEGSFGKAEPLRW